MDNIDPSRLDAALFEAIQNLDVNKVMAALDSGANPAATTENGPVKGLMSALEVVEHRLTQLSKPYI